MKKLADVWTRRKELREKLTALNTDRIDGRELRDSRIDLLDALIEKVFKETDVEIDSMIFEEHSCGFCSSQ
jgi:hypothetical protein